MFKNYSVLIKTVNYYSGLSKTVKLLCLGRKMSEIYSDLDLIIEKGIRSMNEIIEMAIQP